MTTSGAKELTKNSNSSETLSKSSISGRDAALFYTYVSDRVQRDYVDSVTHDQLLEGALSGMLSKLDPYSAYLNAKNFSNIQQKFNGKYGGIGLKIIMEEGNIRVISAIPDTPAAKAGIKTGDYITMINNESIKGLNSIEVAEKLRGDPDTIVHLTLRRGNNDQIKLALKRADIVNEKSVNWHIEKEIGYLQLKTFNKKTTFEMLKGIAEIQQKLGQKLRGFILDLRDNPGGLLEQAVSVADAFLNGGEIVSVQGKDHQKIEYFEAKLGDITKGLPLVVIINGGSASASEIVAGALQDRQRAIIVGTKSFGKGSVQSLVPLKNGGAMKLTTAVYCIPSGPIQKNGIKPDVEVESRDVSSFSSIPNLLQTNEAPHTQSINKEKETLNFPVNEIETSESNQQKLTNENSKNEKMKKSSGQDYQLHQAINVIKILSLIDKDKSKLKIHIAMKKN